MKWIGKNSLSDTSLSDITSVVAGTGLSGGGTTGDVTLNVNVNHDSLAGFVAAEHVDWAGASAGTIHATNIPALNQDTTGTANFAELAGQATTLATARAINGVDFNGSAPITITAAAGTLTGNELKSTVTGSALTSVGAITSGKWNSATEAIPSAYLDADTAHLSGTQTFTGLKTFSLPIITDGDRSYSLGGSLPGDGVAIHVDAFDVTDTFTSASGTAALYTRVKIERGRLLATNSSVTTTAAATLYIQGAPIASTNQTITNPYALWVEDGLVKFDGALTVGGTITGDVTGNVTGNVNGSSGSCTGQAATVATIAGLAPNTATTQATQGNITTLAGLTSFGSAGSTTNIVAGDLTMYNPVNDGNPRFSIGAAGAESVYINPYYDSGAQTLNFADIGTNTADTGANAGYLRFVVDGTPIYAIMDDGILLMDGAGLTIGNSTTGSFDVITDNGSGTTTLSNIDALDATTISTLNAALTAGDITGITAGTGLSGGGASGAVTLNVDAAQTQITSVGTIGTGAWNATPIATAYIADDAVTEDKLANTLLAEIDANTAKNTAANIHGSVIKLIPSDFVANDDGGNQKFGIGYVDNDSTASAYGMRGANSGTELLAFASIPEGMEAVSVHIYDKNDLAIEVFECTISGTTMTSRGTGNCGTTLTLGGGTPVESSAINFLAIRVTSTNFSNDRIYGGIVTIAAI